MTDREVTQFAYEQVNLAVARYSARVAVSSKALIDLHVHVAAEYLDDVVLSAVRSVLVLDAKEAVEVPATPIDAFLFALPVLVHLRLPRWARRLGLQVLLRRVGPRVARWAEARWPARTTTLKARAFVPDVPPPPGSTGFRYAWVPEPVRVTWWDR